MTFVGVMVSTQAATPRHTRRAKTSHTASRIVHHTYQTEPTPERYKEIQTALASKGFLQSTPDGMWDAEAQDALRRFQASQKLEETGKINSLSLIALGLGSPIASKTASASAVQSAQTK